MREPRWLKQWILSSVVASPPPPRRGSVNPGPSLQLDLLSLCHRLMHLNHLPTTYLGEQSTARRVLCERTTIRRISVNVLIFIRWNLTSYHKMGVIGLLLDPTGLSWLPSGGPDRLRLPVIRLITEIWEPLFSTKFNNHYKSVLKDTEVDKIVQITGIRIRMLCGTAILFCKKRIVKSVWQNPCGDLANDWDKWRIRSMAEI